MASFSKNYEFIRPKIIDNKRRFPEPAHTMSFLPPDPPRIPPHLHSEGEGLGVLRVLAQAGLPLGQGQRGALPGSLTAARAWKPPSRAPEPHPVEEKP